MKPVVDGGITHIVDVQHGIFNLRNQGVTFPEKLEAFVAIHSGTEGKEFEIQIINDQYNAGPFPRVNMLVKNRRLGRAQAEILAYWHELAEQAEITVKISFVGHSNGCDVIRHAAIELYKMGVKVTSIIFIAAPLKPNIDKIGLRPLLENGTVISNWCSPNDSVLAAEGSFWGALVRWPYGNAGKVGFEGTDSQVDGYGDLREPALFYNRWFTCGHSEYFENEMEEKTFRMIIREV